jgi:hypothetical protein
VFPEYFDLLMITSVLTTISQEKLELNINNLLVSFTGVKSFVKKESSTGASKKVIMLC